MNHAYLEPGSGRAQTGYLWASNIPGGSVFHHWRVARDAGGVAALFGPAACTIQCDGYEAYAAWARGKPVWKAA